VRIGLIAPPWLPVPPPAYGGTESIIDGLARGLAAMGHEVILAAAANSTCPVPLVPGAEEALLGAQAVGDARTELAHVLAGYAAMGDVDLVHDHTLIGPLCARLPRRRRVVTTNHGPFDDKMTPVFRAMREVPVIAISQQQASTATGVRLAGVIHHGVDVATIPQGRGNGGFMSYLGRMCPEKGPREAAMIARATGVPLRMAAKMREPGEREYFEAEVRPLLCPVVEYVGELGTADKLELLGASFALLNPLRWSEPFGLVMVEALATGTPVVATPLGSAPEIVEDGVTGFLRDDLVDLASALPLAPALDRDLCRKAALQRFDVGRMVSDHAQLYEELVSGGVVPRGHDGFPLHAS
jgi:glycosyltransferase involved in cell wall biosynthesis